MSYRSAGGRAGSSLGTSPLQRRYNHMGISKPLPPAYPPGHPKRDPPPPLPRSTTLPPYSQSFSPASSHRSSYNSPSSSPSQVGGRDVYLSYRTPNEKSTNSGFGSSPSYTPSSNFSSSLSGYSPQKPDYTAGRSCEPTRVLPLGRPRSGTRGLLPSTNVEEKMVPTPTKRLSAFESSPVPSARTQGRRPSATRRRLEDEDYLGSRMQRMSLSDQPQSKHTQPGKQIRALVGLSNLGNTCFMNSCLQSLLSNKDLLDYFGSERYRNDLNKKSRMKGQLAKAFGALSSTFLKSPNNSVERPSELKRLVAVLAPQFAGYGQHDSQEFLRFLLAGLHDECNRIVQQPKYEEIKDNDHDTDEVKSNRWWKNYCERNVSVLSDLFCGQLCSTIVCQKCRHVSKAFDPFWDLSLPIPKSRGLGRQSSVDLMMCFKMFYQQELLAGMDQYYCGKCKKHRDVTKALAIFRFPRVLVVHLKRFQQGGYSRSKLATDVSFPHQLDLSDFKSPIQSSNSLKYHLFAVSNHMGGTGGGHYTAHCNVSSSMSPDAWYTFNDSNVSRVSAGSIGGSSAYVLFYRQVEGTIRQAVL